MRVFAINLAIRPQQELYDIVSPVALPISG